MDCQYDAGRDGRLVISAGSSGNRYKKRHRRTPSANDGIGGRSREAYYPMPRATFMGGVSLNF